MRTKWLLTCLTVLLVVMGMDSVERHPVGTYSMAPGDHGGPVYIESADVLLLESYPVQARLLVRGELPTPCHALAWEVHETEAAIDVLLWSDVDPGVACAQVLEPFEVSIPLGTFENANLPVNINGEPVARLVVGDEPADGGMTLVGAGWSFGMCAGYCNADLAVEAGQLVLVGGGYLFEEPLFENRGSLTDLGRLRLQELLEGLAGVPLEALYGCPDCADGGAAYLTLTREGSTSRHDMEFGHPPEELAGLHAVAMGMVDALETCTTSELVEVSQDCEPWPGP